MTGDDVNGADYSECGWPYAEAWEIVAGGCEVPPSIETFLYGFARSPAVTPQQYAHLVVDAYRRVR